MIKINLLESVTDRQNGTAVAVEKKIASPASRMLMMALAVTGLLLAVIAFDVISTQRAKANAEEELAAEKQKALELEAVMKEQKELEAKINNIDTRINAIKKLRSTQAGPSAVLEALRERIQMTPGLYLDSVEQRGEQLTITGNSPDESVVTQFGRSLEFSSGLFSNLNIETTRRDDPTAQPASAGSTNPVNQIVNFKIICAYTPSKASAAQSGGIQPNGVVQPAANMPQPNANMPQPQAAKPQQPAPSGQPAPNAATPPQVAKN